MPTTEVRSKKTALGSGSYFADKEIALIYDLNAESTVEVDDGKFKEYNVFKILTQEQLGTTEAINFARVHPHFVTAKDGSTKLLINVGTQDRSISLFNLNGFSLLAPAGSLAKVPEFEVLQLDGTYKGFELKTLVEEDPANASKGRSAWLVIILTIAVILVVVLVVAGLFVGKKDQLENEELNLDPVEQTIRLGDQEGSYSKL